MIKQQYGRHSHIMVMKSNPKKVTGLKAMSNYDPTHTITLRNLYVREMNKRFNQLKRQIRLAIVEQDCFGLSKNTTSSITIHSLPGAKAYAFQTSDAKVNSFMAWLKDETDNTVLGAPGRMLGGNSNPTNWNNVYIEGAYQKGIARARAEMLKAKYDVPPLGDSNALLASFNSPVHSARAGLLYSRVYSDLQGITAAMDAQIGKVLSQGMIDGKGPMELARLLNKTISGTGGTLEMKDTLGRFIPAQRRAQTLARTEIIRAHHTATIQEYQNWEVAGVKVKAEFQTAGDDRVCPECANLQGQVFTLAQIQNVIPVHPNCRCCALPMDMDEDNADRKNVKEVPPMDESGDTKAERYKNEAKALGISIEEYPPFQKLLKEDIPYRKEYYKNLSADLEKQRLARRALREETQKAQARVPYTPSKTLDELKEQFRTKLGVLEVKGVTSLNDPTFYFADKAGNTLGNEVLNRFPLLREKFEAKFSQNPHLLSFHLDTKGVGYPGMTDGALAYYQRSTRSITIQPGGMVRTTAQLHIGPRDMLKSLSTDFNVGIDYASSVRHEFGHHVMRTLVDKKGTDVISDMYMHFGKNSISNQISKYAGTNFSEMFAECFSAYTSPLYGTAKGSTLPDWAEAMVKAVVGDSKEVLEFNAMHAAVKKAVVKGAI